MHSFLAGIKSQVQGKKIKIVFPEALIDDRFEIAIKEIVTSDLCIPVLVGGTDAQRFCDKLGLKSGEEIIIVDRQFENEAAKKYFELRKHKGISEVDAREKMLDLNFYATMLLILGQADGMLSGSVGKTATSVIPALQTLIEADDFPRVSGLFFLLLDQRLLVFADCSMNVAPTSEDLAGFAMDTALTARQFGLEPKVALLSFTSHATNDFAETKKVKDAYEILKSKNPDFIFDGEIQVDAAIVPEVYLRKCPESPLKGEANVLIFPSLEAANIGYKLVERLAGADALGPVLQGLKKPVNDLSRGCSVMDIVNMAAITAFQALKQK